MPDGTHQGCTPRGTEPRTKQLAAAVDGSLRTLEEDLAAHSESREDRTGRRETDARLLSSLRREGFTGPRYQQFLTGLMTYGWRTLNHWSITGYIFERTASMGRPVPAHLVPEKWDYADRTQVVTDTVLQGSALFREHGLVRGKWTPHGGASLTTYFVGASVLAFRSVFTRWSQAHRLGQAELDHRTAETDDVLRAQYDIPDQRAIDPATAAVIHDDIARLLPHLSDEQLREALAWMTLGYTQAEAARQVGLTPKALERRLARARTKVSTGALRGQPEEGGAR